MKADDRLKRLAAKALDLPQAAVTAIRLVGGTLMVYVNGKREPVEWNLNNEMQQETKRFTKEEEDDETQIHRETNGTG
jgi:hypothetical protein